MKKIKEFFRKLLPQCPKCNEGKIRYIGEDYRGMGLWINIYECDHCHNQYI